VAKNILNCVFKALFSYFHKSLASRTVPKIEPLTRKHPKKIEHEIHRAIRWKNEMEELGIGQNELARRKGCLGPAVAAVMAWLKLSKEALDLIIDIPNSKSTRQISRSYRKRLLKLNPKGQVAAIAELLSR
jgi:hypothetical protein